MKPSYSKKNITHLKSLPTWERGLKRCDAGHTAATPEVAPYVGAWIETSATDKTALSFIVAPYVGAWIETAVVIEDESRCGLLPTWERGLKQRLLY